MRPDFQKWPPDKNSGNDHILFLIFLRDFDLLRTSMRQIDPFVKNESTQ